MGVLLGFIRAVNFKRIQLGLLAEEFWQRRRPVSTRRAEAPDQTQAKTNTAAAGKYRHHLWVTSAPPPPLLLICPPTVIAVVSYGFLFLRDGRWVHVGVEATKHAVRAQPATGGTTAATSTRTGGGGANRPTFLHFPTCPEVLLQNQEVL